MPKTWWAYGHSINPKRYGATIMSEKERIIKDIRLFETHVSGITEKATKPVEWARQYYQDAKYYMEKKDYFTAFGCINYAHGLLDAIRLLSQTL